MENSVKEIYSLKAKFDLIKPIKPENKKKLDEKFRLEFNYNSNHIEGNTLTYGETKLFLIFGDDAKLSPNHNFREYQEMKAHDLCFSLIEDWAFDENFTLKEIDIKNLHKILLVEPFFKEAVDQFGNKTRKKIEIGTYKNSQNYVELKNGEMFNFASITDTPILMKELLDWLSEQEKAQKDPVLTAILFHYKFVKIHPFDDGNGRMARLLSNYLLLKNNFPPIIIKSSDKDNYFNALRNADAGNIDFFIEYNLKQLIWSLNLAIKAAQGEDVEENDDLDKKISLTEKKLKLKKDINNVNTSYLCEEVIFPALQYYCDKISKFSKLFKFFDVKYNVLIKNRGYEFKNSKELKEFCAKNEKDLSRILIRVNYQGVINGEKYFYLNFYEFEYQNSIDLNKIKSSIDSEIKNFLDEINKLI
jgi:Fic family protein